MHESWCYNVSDWHWQCYDQQQLRPMQHSQLQGADHTSKLAVGKDLCICDVAALPKEKEKLCFRERYRATCPLLLAVYVFVSVVCCIRMLSLPSPSHLFQHTSAPTLHLPHCYTDYSCSVQLHGTTAQKL
jgi:hypothetical protein